MCQLQEEHLEIKEKLNGMPRLRWSDVSNMPYTNKVSSKAVSRQKKFSLFSLL